MKFFYLKVYTFFIFINALPQKETEGKTVDSFLNAMKEINDTYKKRIKDEQQVIFTKADYDLVANEQIKILEGDLHYEYGDKKLNIEKEIETIKNNIFKENKEHTYIPTEKLFFTEDELNQIFKCSIECIKNFFNINTELIKNLESNFNNDSKLNNNQEIKDFFENMIKTINDYYQKLFQELENKNKKNIYDEQNKDKINEEKEKKINYFNVIQKTKNNKNEKILVTTDNHSSKDYFEFLKNKLKNPYSNEYFCGDVIDRSQYYYWNLVEKEKLIKTLGKNYEKKLFICDFLQSILLLTTKIFVHKTHPNAYFEVLGNHEFMIFDDMRIFLNKLKINNNFCTEISDIMQIMIPAQIMTINENHNKIDVFNHSGGGFYLPINDLKTKKIENEKFNAIKIFYSTEKMLKELETNENNSIYHSMYNDQKGTELKSVFDGTYTRVKKATLGKSCGKRERNSNILLWCDFLHFKNKNLSDNNHNDREINKISIDYNDSRGIRVKTMNKYMINYLPSIYNKMVQAAFPDFKINNNPSYTFYYGHQHDEENLQQLINTNNGYNELHMKWNESVTSVFLPPAHCGNNYGLLRKKFLFNNFFNNGSSDTLSCCKESQFISHDDQINSFLKQKELEELKEELELAISTFIFSVPSGVAGVLLKEILEDTIPKNIRIKNIFDKDFFPTCLLNLKNNRDKSLPSITTIRNSKTFWITMGASSLVYYSLKKKKFLTIKEKIKTIFKKKE